MRPPSAETAASSTWVPHSRPEITGQKVMYCEIIYFRGAQFSWIHENGYIRGDVISWVGWLV